jgi:hypothetical protein
VAKVEVADIGAQLEKTVGLLDKRSPAPEPPEEVPVMETAKGSTSPLANSRLTMPRILVCCVDPQEEVKFCGKMIIPLNFPLLKPSRNSLPPMLS